MAWSAIIETPTLDMPIMQPMFTAVSLRLRVMLQDGRMMQRLRKLRRGTATAHDALQACNPGHMALVVL